MAAIPATLPTTWGDLARPLEANLAGFSSTLFQSGRWPLRKVALEKTPRGVAGFSSTPLLKSGVPPQHHDMPQKERCKDDPIKDAHL